MSVIAASTFSFCAVGLSASLSHLVRQDILYRGAHGQSFKYAQSDPDFWSCCVYRQTFNKALKLLSSFENLATHFCVSFRDKNWALAQGGWAPLLCLTLEDMPANSGGAHIRAASYRRGLEVWTASSGVEVGLRGH